MAACTNPPLQGHVDHSIRVDYTLYSSRYNAHCTPNPLAGDTLLCSLLTGAFAKDTSPYLSSIFFIARSRHERRPLSTLTPACPPSPSPSTSSTPTVHRRSAPQTRPRLDPPPSPPWCRLYPLHSPRRTVPHALPLLHHADSVRLGAQRIAKVNRRNCTPNHGLGRDRHVCAARRALPRQLIHAHTTHNVPACATSSTTRRTLPCEKRARTARCAPHRPAGNCPCKWHTRLWNSISCVADARGRAVSEFLAHRAQSQVHRCSPRASRSDRRQTTRRTLAIPPERFHAE